MVRQAQDERGVGGNGIATWFDRLTMSGCAARNDKVGTREPAAQLAAPGCGRYNAAIERAE